MKSKYIKDKLYIATYKIRYKKSIVGLKTATLTTLS